MQSLRGIFYIRFFLLECKYSNTVDPFNDWGGRGCNEFVPVLGGNGTKIASTGDIFDQPLGNSYWRSDGWLSSGSNDLVLCVNNILCYTVSIIILDTG